MRCLSRNKRTFYYAIYQGETEIVDDYGNATGQYTVAYGNPVQMYANVSAARGTADAELFGINTVYDKVIVTDDMSCPIAESSILWLDAEPTIVEGATETPHDYIVTRVAKSLNSIAIAVRKVEVS